MTGPVDALLELVAGGAGVPEDDAEPVTLLEHALQCAAILARRRPADLELQAAGLLHDVGHTLVPGDPAGHGDHAAAHLRPLLGDRVADLVALHVPAKRWLVAADPGYGRRLSGRSVETLGAQGGAMAPGEAAAFAAHPHHGDAVVLRRADEAAKVAGRAAGDPGRWRPVLEAVAGRRR